MKQHAVGTKVSLKKRIEAVELKQVIDRALQDLEHKIRNLDRLIQKDYWGVHDRNWLERCEHELSMRIVRR